ncbi:divalent-cation tolerance protein CutA [Thermodesulfobacteriota bacterium]
MTDYIQVSTTAGSKEDAQKIARVVVEKRLAACAQVMGPITSIYWWQEKMEEEEEWLCLMKTQNALYHQLDSAIKAIHPYEEPEIIALPIASGSPGYLDWLKRETT